MAIEGRSHMCISCCTNIVQCRAWNKEKGGGRQAAFSMNDWFAGYSSISIVHIRLSHQQARVPLNQAKRNASLLFKTVKEIWVSWGLRKRNPNLFYGDFPLPPPLPCGDFWQHTNRQSILSLQLLSIFRDKRKKGAGEELELCAAMLGDSRRAGVFCTQLCSKCLKLVFSLQKCGRVGQKKERKGISLNTVEVTKALAKENT